MNKYTDFPEQPRLMTAEEGERYYNIMLDQIRAYEPDEIIAVSRSGFSYAQWVAQDLNIKNLGVYYPDVKQLISRGGKRLVFVDDNLLSGSTYLEAREHIKKNVPSVEMRWAVLFTDWHTPDAINDAVFKGVKLPYFAEEPVWGSRKISKDYGIRYRDE